MTKDYKHTKVTTYQYGTSAVKVCISQALAEKRDKLIGMDYKLMGTHNRGHGLY